MPAFRIPLFTLVLALGLVAVGCDKKPAATPSEDAGKVLVTVNGEAITEKDFQQYLQLRQARQEPVADKEKEQKIVLDEMVDRILLTQRAAQNGMEKDPEVQTLMKRVRENILVQAMVRNMLKDNPITDGDLRQRFDKEVGNTHKTEYSVRHILVKNEDEAKEITNQLKAKSDFAKLAKQKSIDVQSGKNGGQLGWVNQGAVVPEFFDAVTRLKKGETSPAPVKSDFGWHVIKVEDTRPAKIPSFEQFMADKQTRANLHRKMQDEKIEKLVKDLRANAKITVNETTTKEPAAKEPASKEAPPKPAGGN